MPDFLAHLTSVTVRSLILFAAAGAAILAVRAKGAATRHAVWTVVLGGMLALAIVSPMLPAMPLPLLKTVASAPAQLPDLAALPATTAATPTAPPPSWRITWPLVAIALYALVTVILLVRLLYGYLFTRRLVRAATPIPGAEDIHSSTWISVPVTVGRKVILPAGWIEWDNDKLDAVLAHERTHVRRGDWAIALLAGVNRSIFWFHPLAWWLERHLATLAEQACDDSALLLVDSRPYAQALLDMAAAARTTQGRLVWEAMAMAKTAEVRKRIELILDETRQIPRALTRARWVAILACSLPMIWLVSVGQLVPAIAQDAPQTPAAMAEYLKGRRQFSPADVQTMEQYLVKNPHDIETRSQLVLHYYANEVREPRISHILWMIENHPGATQTIFASQGVLPRDNALNSFAEYQRVLEAWKQAVASRKGDAEAARNAARFLQISGEFEQAEKLLLDTGALNRGTEVGPGFDQLARLYAAAILGATGDPSFPNPSPSFAARVRRDLEASENRFLMGIVGNMLRASAQRPRAGQPLPQGVLNLDDHPLLLSAIDFGDRLIVRAQQFGTVPMGVPGGVPGGIPGGVRGGVIGGIVSAPGAPRTLENPAAVAPATPPPPIVKKVDPVYPPLARQARISGVVHLQVVIAADGTLKNIQIMSGHPLLVPATLEAVKQWQFQPLGREVSTYLDVPFVLAPGEAPAGQSFNATLPVMPSRIKVGGNVQSAKLVRKVDPEYPAQARAERITGDITLQIVIDKTGKVIDAAAIEGNPVLAKAALVAVWQWVYQPTLLNGEPVEVSTIVTVPFRME